MKLPPGNARIEVSKGYSYYTSIGDVQIKDGATVTYLVTLQRVIDMPRYGWHSTDTHLHFDRSDAGADGPILDLLSAEDIEFGHILTKESAKGYGMDSLHASGRYSIVSGREVTSPGLGHVNQLIYRHLAPAEPGVPLATLYDQAIADGGAMQHDHAGYGQEIYADVVLGKSDAVELIQFGLYRPAVGLDGYYLFLNSGYRYPLLGASDYPVCRTMSDSRTFVADGTNASFPTAVGRLLRGQSFATSGPLLFLSVDGKGPGNDIEFSGDTAQTVTVRVLATSGDLPFNTVEIVQDGKIAGEWHGVEPVFQKELKTTLRVSESSWIAARCSGPGTANAHTNPVWIYFNGRAPFKPEAVRELRTRIDAFENTKVNQAAKAIAETAAEKVGVAQRPAPLERFPVRPSNAALFPPVLPRPKLLAPVTMEGMAVDRKGKPLAGVMVSVRGAGPTVRTESTGRFVLAKVNPNSPLFLRLSKTGYATTNTAYLNPHCAKAKLRVVVMRSADAHGASATVFIDSKVPFTSPRVKMIDASVGVVNINLQPAYPAQTNAYEPNVIITATPSGKDIVMPVFAGQVTYAAF